MASIQRNAKLTQPARSRIGPLGLSVSVLPTILYDPPQPTRAPYNCSRRGGWRIGSRPPLDAIELRRRVARCNLSTAHRRIYRISTHSYGGYPPIRSLSLAFLYANGPWAPPPVSPVGPLSTPRWLEFATRIRQFCECPKPATKLCLALCGLR